MAGIRTPGNTKDVELLSWAMGIGKKVGAGALWQPVETGTTTVLSPRSCVPPYQRRSVSWNYFRIARGPGVFCDRFSQADSSLIGVLRIGECRTRNRCLIGRPTLSPVRGHEFAVGTYHQRRSGRPWPPRPHRDCNSRMAESRNQPNRLS